MADEYNGNFINPAYATPAQVKQLRDYAEQLQKGSIAPTSNSWAGALAQGLMGFNAANNANRANTLEQGGIRGAAQQDTTARQLQGANALPSNDIYGAITQQESGGNPNAPTSINGAVGQGQIMPGTFKQYARPGENINNPADNAAVSQRIVQDYSQKYNGDPARVATAYFSGPGNVAPPGSPTPWKNDAADGNGKRVSSYVSDIAARLMGKPPQQQAQNGITPYSAYQHNPWANPQEQGLARGLITPAPTPDVYGRPGITSAVGGARALPTAPGFQPGVMVPQGVSGEGGVTTQSPLLPPGQGGGGNLQSQIQPLVDVGKNVKQQVTANNAISGGIDADMKAANAAFPIMQNLDLMINDVNKHGNNMTLGPSAELVTNFKKVIAQHAPGLMSQADLEGLASQDSLRKQTAYLATAIGRSTGNTDLSLMQGKESVPGEHNSKEGLLAIADMLKQQVGLNARFVMENYKNYGQTGFDPIAAKAAFYKQNPIINPLTHNPVTVDLAQGERGTRSQQDFKKLSDQELKARLGIK